MQERVYEGDMTEEELAEYEKEKAERMMHKPSRKMLNHKK